MCIFFQTLPLSAFFRQFYEFYCLIYSDWTSFKTLPNYLLHRYNRGPIHQWFNRELFQFLDSFSQQLLPPLQPRTQQVLGTHIDPNVLATSLLALQQQSIQGSVQNQPQVQPNLSQQTVTMTLQELQNFVLEQGRRLRFERNQQPTDEHPKSSHR